MTTSAATQLIDIGTDTGMDTGFDRSLLQGTSPGTTLLDGNPTNPGLRGRKLK